MRDRLPAPSTAIERLDRASAAFGVAMPDHRTHRALRDRIVAAMSKAMRSDGVTEVCEHDTSGAANIGHGCACSDHPVGAAALACLGETKRLKATHEVVGDVRGGRGLMAALERVADRPTTPPGDKRAPIRVQQSAYENGVMVRAFESNHILSPPLIATESDIDRIPGALDAAPGTLEHEGAGGPPPSAGRHPERSLG